MQGGLWQDPAGAGQAQLYDWSRRLMLLFRQSKHKDYHFVSVTLTAGTSTTVTDTKITANSRVFVTPTNAAARALPVHKSAQTAGASFVLTHGAAAGSETYDALVID